MFILVRGEWNLGRGEGGSKDDAAHLLALVLARHTDTDYETPKALNIKDILPMAGEQAEFEAWLGQNSTPDVRRAIKEMGSAISSGLGGGGAGDNSTFVKSIVSAGKGSTLDSREEDEEDDDVLGAFGKKPSPSSRRSSLLTSKDKGGTSKMASLKEISVANPTKWAESEMASETKGRDSGAIFLEEEVRSAVYFCY